MSNSTIDKISHLLLGGFTDWKSLGEFYTREQGDLILFCYNPQCGFKQPEEWNEFEKVARGLIMNKVTGKCIARPFDKFFNNGQVTTESELKEVQEKMDGSLAISYYQDGWKIATKGSFESDQAIAATSLLNSKYITYNLNTDGYTFLFEYIATTNRIVVDYSNTYGKGYDVLVLLAIRHNTTGMYSTHETVKKCAELMGCPYVSLLSDKEDILTMVQRMKGVECEGVVATFKDGTRIKYKNDEYLKLHRLVSDISPKNILECIINGTIDDVRKDIPDDFIDEFDGIVKVIKDRRNEIALSIIEAYDDLVSKEFNNRKELAIYIIKRV